MTTQELETLFKKHDDEFLKFDRVQTGKHKRPDLCAFILLDKIMPDTVDIVCHAEHDEVFLGIDVDKLAERITEEQVLYLIRCGVFLDQYHCCLAMFT